MQIKLAHDIIKNNKRNKDKKWDMSYLHLPTMLINLLIFILENYKIKLRAYLVKSFLHTNLAKATKIDPNHED